MKNAITLLLILLPLATLAQEVRKQTNKETNERYYVLKTDNKTRHGEYTQKIDGKQLVKGQYSNGVRTGIWEYYNPSGVLIQSYDYDKETVPFFSPQEEISSWTFQLTNCGSCADTSLSRGVVFLGGSRYFFSLLAQAIRYPEEAKENGEDGRVHVLFTVDKHGKRSNFRVKVPVGYGLDEEALRVMKTIDGVWLPAIKDGKYVDATVDALITFLLR